LILWGSVDHFCHAGRDLGDATKAFDYNMAMSIVTTFDVNEVPDDGGRYVALHPYAWAQFLKVPEFANADYVGAENLPFKGGMQAKYWMGILWFPLPNVTWGVAGGNAADVATNLAWHKSVLGHGINKEIDTKWDWENTYSAWSCVSCMSLGATIIEDTGVYAVSSLSAKPAA
jgi:Phage capsid protein